jgi:hypothetical protein
MFPELVTFVDGLEWLRTRAPAELGPRAWILGVVAVQLSVESGRLTAQVRANVTGDAPSLRPLPSSAIIQIALVAPGAPAPPLPALQVPPLAGAEARLALFLDGDPVDEVALSPALFAAEPPPRAFGHVFCRWLRSGEVEPGFDLTDFCSQPPGQKYERRVIRSLSVGETVSYLIRSR